MKDSRDRRSFLNSIVEIGFGGGAVAMGSLLRSDTANAATLPSNSSLSRGTKWLLDQQAEDGGWHSATYGAMRGGVGNTALVLYALAQLPKSILGECRVAFERGISFVMPQFHQPDETDYPTYAAALLLIVLRQADVSRWKKERDQIRDFLLTQQRDARTAPENAGGWGATHGDGTDDANLSVTRFVLESMGSNLDNDDQRRAQAFVERCQNFGEGRDGGFFFTPREDDPLNKAGESRSYGTATADGLLALLACGCKVSHPRVQAAIHWLDRHGDLGAVPGIPVPKPSTSSFGEGLRFYYYAALATVILRLPRTPLAERRLVLVREIQSRQRADGSWKNQSTAMKEDDPLIATSLATIALGKLRE